MAREKQEESSGDVPPWMVTYSDLMTLLLTFFVLLISMSYIDERRLRDFLITTRGSAIGQGMFNPLSSRDSRYSVQPGPMDPEVG
ncbi:MAG: flagellar motor protein MotB, partial [Desulfovibrionaceae bacterium]|nr:flagellar motor protein MotB [Desulfovibrionaceae bacterium]